MVNSSWRHEAVPALVKIYIQTDLGQPGNRAVSPKVGALGILNGEVGTNFKKLETQDTNYISKLPSTSLLRVPSPPGFSMLRVPWFKFCKAESELQGIPI